MITACAISDLHGTLPVIRWCNVVFICGDTFPLEIQRINTECEAWFTTVFRDWVKSIPCKTVYIIGGNHCFWFERMGYDYIVNLINNTEGLAGKLVYIKDNLVETEEGITIYGCPYSTGPRGWAFISEDGSKYNNIPDCDVLLTHQPPKIGKLGCSYPDSKYERDFGSDVLRSIIDERNIQYNFCGHIHTGEHKGLRLHGTKFYNVSLKDEDYRVSYEPLYVEIEPAHPKFTKHMEKVISKSLDIAYDYIKEKVESEPTVEAQKETLFDTYIEYTNGYDVTLLNEIKSRI